MLLGCEKCESKCACRNNLHYHSTIPASQRPALNSYQRTLLIAGRSSQADQQVFQVEQININSGTGVATVVSQELKAALDDVVLVLAHEQWEVAHFSLRVVAFEDTADLKQHRPVIVAEQVCVHNAVNGMVVHCVPSSILGLDTVVPNRNGLVKTKLSLENIIMQQKPHITNVSNSSNLHTNNYLWKLKQVNY